MAQISMPYRIALIAIVAIALVWFVALRPKEDEGGEAAAPPAAQGAAGPAQPGTAPAPAQPGTAQAAPATSAPGTTQAGEGFGEARDAAQSATDGANATNAQREDAAAAAGQPDGTTPAPGQAGAGTAPGAPATSGAPAPEAGASGTDPAASGSQAPLGAYAGTLMADRANGGATLSGPQRASAAVAEGKVLVLGFFNPRAADDKAVRRELDTLKTSGGRVTVVSAPLAAVSRYDAVVGGVTIATSPTVVVVGPDRTARTLTGFIDGGTLKRVVDTTLAGARGR